MRKPLVVANWKCNPTTLDEAGRLFNSVKKGIRNIKNVQVVICPPFVYLTGIKHQRASIKLGAQDCFWEEKGAYTGEISPIMLKNMGCEYVIIGHSERRMISAETDNVINKKLKAAMKAKLKPILCIGETKKERKERTTFKVLKKQLESALKGILNPKSLTLNSLIVAYEPVWAIGTENPCLPTEAQKVLSFLKKNLKNTPIIYGGSVNSANAPRYIKEANFDGLLPGGASLIPKEFISLVKNVSQS